MTKERHTVVFDTLLLRICSLAYPPGSCLSEVALGHEFGLSRTPVRQVLQRLELYGLVVPRNGIGTVVTELTAQEITELGECRQHLASVMSAMMSTAGFDLVADQFERLRADTDALAGASDVQAAAAIGLQMHESLSSLISNEEFKLVWHQLYFKHSRSAYRLLATDWANYIRMQCGELDDYVDVLRTGSPEGVAALYRRRIRSWSDYALSSLRS